jgi:glycosyltransferase involved in cell wall biosynthesis
VSCNSGRALTDFSAFIPREKIAFLPNFYPVMFGSPDGEWPHSRHADGPLHIACPGAVRPLKNHLIQAVAALKAARSLNRYLIFHVNSTRVECSGSNVLKNLRALFDGLPYGELVEEEWRDHGAFKDFLGTMDVVMQVSYTETFNIVGADAVAMGVPLVASPEIVWSDPRHQCPCDDSEQQALAILQALQHPRPAFARMRLKQHVQDVPEIWMKQLSLT